MGHMMMKRSSLVALALVALASLAGPALAVTFDAKNFPDEAFRDYLVSEQGLSFGQPLDAATIASITEIDVSGMSIKTLKGIEHLTALERLNCKGNELEELDLSKNTDLTDLSCTENHLVVLDLSNNSKIPDPAVGGQTRDGLPLRAAGGFFTADLGALVGKANKGKIDMVEGEDAAGDPISANYNAQTGIADFGSKEPATVTYFIKVGHGDTTMDVTLTTEVSWSVTVEATTHGTASADPELAPTGATVTVETAPQDGYELASIDPIMPEQLDVELDEETGKATFKMPIPGADVKVKAIFRPLPPTGLTPVAPTATDAKDGKIEGVTADMEYSANGKTWTSCPKKGKAITGLEPGKYQVRFKAADLDGEPAGRAVEVTVPQAGSNVYDVKLDVGQGGTAQASHESAAAGTTVTITATPTERGYVVDGIVWAREGGKGTNATITGPTTGTRTGTFTMPAAPVTVTVTFKKTSARIPATGITLNATELKFEFSQTGGYGLLTASLTPPNATDVVTWSWSGNDYTMPLTGVKVVADPDDDRKATLTTRGGESGECTVTATAGKHSASCHVSITPGTTVNLSNPCVPAVGGNMGFGVFCLPLVPLLALRRRKR